MRNQTLINILMSGEDQNIATVGIRNGKLMVDTALPDAEAIVLLQAVVVAMEEGNGVEYEETALD